MPIFIGENEVTFTPFSLHCKQDCSIGLLFSRNAKKKKLKSLVMPALPNDLILCVGWLQSEVHWWLWNGILTTQG